MKEKLVTIQATIPICPNCHAGLERPRVFDRFKCPDCKKCYPIIGLGMNDKTFICTMK